MLRDREQGGRLLARELGRVRVEDPVVLGVVRGGVPVALEVAKAFHAPLDVIAVQKVGAPEFPECTVAAVAEGGALYLRHRSLHDFGMTDVEAAEIAQRAAVELAQRVRWYRGDAPPFDVAGRTVLVVDDGVATGATAFAAARAVRSRGAARVVLAAPVIAAGAEPELLREFDEVVAVDRPRPFVALQIWYEHFDRVPEDVVVQCARRGGEHLTKREADRIWDGELRSEVADGRAAAFRTEVLAIPCTGAPTGALDSELVLPPRAVGIVVFSTGSTRDSPRYRLISRALHQLNLATLRCELLTSSEGGTRAMPRPVDARVLTSRIQTVVRWMSAYPATRGLHRGLYAAGDGAEAGLVAVAGVEDLVEAVVVRAGRLDTVPPLTLASVHAPVLLLVGSRDENVLSANRAALAHLATADLVVVPGATDVFGEPGALEAVGRLAAEWFKRWLERAAAHGPPRPLRATQ